MSMPPPEAAPRPRLPALTPALLAWLLYGSWACYVNWDYGLSPALTAFVAQGIASFSTTLFLTRLIEFLYRHIPTRGLKAALTPVGAIALIGITLYAIHRLSGTPDIALTIAPSLLIGFAYCLYCTYRLDRLQWAAAQ